MTCQFLNIKPLNYNVIVTKMSYSDDFNNCFLQSKKKKKNCFLPSSIFSTK